MALYPIPIRWEVLQFMEFSVPVQLDAFYLMQKLPEEQSRLSAITRPFSTPVILFVNYKNPVSNKDSYLTIMESSGLDFYNTVDHHDSIADECSYFFP